MCSTANLCFAQTWGSKTIIRFYGFLKPLISILLHIVGLGVMQLLKAKLKILLGYTDISP